MGRRLDTIRINIRSWTIPSYDVLGLKNDLLKQKMAWVRLVSQWTSTKLMLFQ
ncbi:hypothetical protein SPHINGO8BC_90175 [Sphingobacterium multivorum]|uniref:Uncharacterized protein n=1 Tax=Sphingobacterium multivorum TaxID=28454 RepID=A0A654DR91_SPHMU|nr:hypothetical protein SPHINGO8BC_90175 [Sphingobacterium multivorum]